MSAKGHSRYFGCLGRCRLYLRICCKTIFRPGAKNNFLNQVSNSTRPLLMVLLIVLLMPLLMVLLILLLMPLLIRSPPCRSCRSSICAAERHAHTMRGMKVT